MEATKLKRLKRKLASLRTAVCNLRSRQIVRFAESLGRKRDNRGSEPTYINEMLPGSRPLTIPNHPGALNKFTAGNILDQLEQDISMLEELSDCE